MPPDTADNHHPRQVPHKVAERRTHTVEADNRNHIPVVLPVDPSHKPVLREQRVPVLPQQQALVQVWQPLQA